MRLFFESTDFISASVIGIDLSLVLATGCERWNFEGFLFFFSPIRHSVRKRLSPLPLNVINSQNEKSIVVIVTTIML